MLCLHGSQQQEQQQGRRSKGSSSSGSNVCLLQMVYQTAGIARV
jgi:hypothetical protein